MCTNGHKACLTCARSILDRKPACPFCRQSFSEDLKSQLLREPLLPPESRIKRKTILKKVGLLVFLVALAVLCTIFDQLMNSCEFWGQYSRCFLEGIVYFCERKDQCLAHHFYCAELDQLEVPWIYFGAIGMIFSCLLSLLLLCNIIKDICQ